MQKITTFLAFNDQAEAAARFYTQIFAGSRVVSVSKNGDAVFGVTFELEGQTFYAMNGGPHFKFNEGISLFVSADNQAEIDRLWEALTASGGEPSRCGWLKDRFGVWWQIVPPILSKLLTDPDPARSGRVMQAMMNMGKLDIAALQAAAKG